MKKLVIEFSNERLITPSGLSLVGQMLGKSNFIKKCNNMKVDGKRSQSQIKNGIFFFLTSDFFVKARLHMTPLMRCLMVTVQTQA